MKKLFDAFALEAEKPFRLIGEQIDGSFLLDRDTYLVEAKWQNELTGATDLHAFQGKLDQRAAWGRDLFVSYSGFTALRIASLHSVEPGRWFAWTDEI